MTLSEQAQLPTNEIVAEVKEFNAVEVLQLASATAGWTIEYRQLEAGRLRARTGLFGLTEVSLIRESVNRRMEIVGEPPAGMLTVGVRVFGDDLKINGNVFDDGSLLVIMPGAELHALTGSCAEVLTMHVPESLLEAQSNELLPRWQRFTRGQAVAVRASYEAIDHFGHRMLSLLRPMMDKKWEQELVSGLLTHFICMSSGLENGSQERDRDGQLHRYRILRRAREHIEEHLSGPIRMAHLCRYCGASLSTLERVFRREMQMTPSEYIQTRRLNAVRRVITGDEAANRPITRIALDYGFNHLGRFSMAYRCHFGQSPSEVRRGARWQRR